MKCCELMHFLIVILSDICQQWPISWTLLWFVCREDGCWQNEEKGSGQITREQKKKTIFEGREVYLEGRKWSNWRIVLSIWFVIWQLQTFFHNYFSMDKFVYYLYHICFRNWTFCERRGYRKNSRSCAKAQLFLLFKFEKLLSTQCCYFRSGNHWPE